MPTISTSPPERADFSPASSHGSSWTNASMSVRPLNTRGRGRAGPVASTTASASSVSPEASTSDQPPSRRAMARTLPATQRVEPSPGVRSLRLASRASR